MVRMLFPGDSEPKDLLLEKMQARSDAQEQRERGCSASREIAAAGSQDMQKMRSTVCNRSRGQAILLRQVQIWERAKSVTRETGVWKLMNMENVSNSKKGQASRQKSSRLTLKCDPSQLPEPTIPATPVMTKEKKPKEIENILKDYFFHSAMRSRRRQ